MPVGTIVRDSAGLQGIVVADLDEGQFSSDYPRTEWGYLARGILVKTDEAGLVHYENAGEVTLVACR